MTLPVSHAVYFESFAKRSFGRDTERNKGQESLTVKHLRKLTQTPALAQDPTPGQILQVIAQVLAILATALVAKEGGSSS